MHVLDNFLDFFLSVIGRITAKFNSFKPIMKTANKLTITHCLPQSGIMQAACAQGHANDGSIYQFFLMSNAKKSSPNALRHMKKYARHTIWDVSTYWRLNYNLSGQSPEAVNQFVHQYQALS